MDFNIWQIGTGDDARPYDQYFVKYQVVLLGSGTDGKWSSENPAYADRGDIRAFAGRAAAGDLVVARRGLSRALALGVLGDYDWSNCFDDVKGWDLQHYRRVRWIGTREKRFAHPVFPQSRFSKSKSEEVRTWATRIARKAPTLAPPEADRLAPLPAEEKSLAVSRLPRAIRKVVERARRLDADIWSGKYDTVPSEDELLTHITVPLLEALGWEPEQIAVKWKYTDLALFNPVKREPANCHLVVEGKRVGTGLRFAGDQARRYSKELRLAGADVLVTNGISYELYRAPDYSDETALRANLARPRESAANLFDALRAP